MVPRRAVLLAELEVPMKPTTATVKTVPTGTFAAERLTVTGLLVVPGNTTSGAKNEAFGLAGAATPPTEVIWSSGELDRVTEVGAPELTEAPTPPAKVAVSVLVN